MAAQYELRPGEWVVLEAGQGAHLRSAANPSRPSLSGSMQMLVLTNQNIVLTTLNLLRKPKQHRIFPLSDIVQIDGEPHLRVAGTIGQNLLEVHFKQGMETFSFQRKPEVQEWAQRVRELVTGTAADFDPTRDHAGPGAATLVDSLKDTVGVFRDVLGLASSAALPPPPLAPRVATECTSCGASISGRQGRVVRCEFCASERQL